MDKLLTPSTVDRDEPIEEIVTSDLESIQAEERVFKEGGKQVRYTNRFERDTKLRAAAIKNHGTTSKACGFNFGSVYGERGVGFIEVHHLRPVSSLKKKTEIDPKKEMTVICSNCHRMIHRRKDSVLSLRELKQLMRTD